MKNLILIFLLAQLLILPLGLVIASSVPQSAVMQDEASSETTSQPTVEKKGFFNRLWNSAKENAVELAVSFVVGIFAKHGWTQVIKKIASRGTIITKELSEFLAATSDGLATIDKAIRTDGKLEEDSLSEILASKKKFVAELNDVIVSIKPKT